MNTINRIVRRMAMVFLPLCLAGMMLTSCEKTEVPVFKLVRQTLAEGEVVDSLLSTAMFTYSQPIQLVKPERITLEGATISPWVKGAQLHIEIEGLRGESQYTLCIGHGAIEDINGQKLPDLKMVFNTSGEREITVQLATQKALGTASMQALKVYKFLRDNYGIRTISATMANVSFNTNEAQWVYKHTGHWPAMNCIDFIHMGEPFANYTDMTQMQDWWDNNGIILACWHWRVPIAQGSEVREFYSKDNNFNPANAVIPGTWENDFIEADIENLAVLLKQFKDAGIPVIWRPFHEAAGGWFWWGNGSGATYVQLWQWMFNKLVKEHKLNNLIWVWTTENNDDTWYPGDDYVDIIGRDIYNQASTTMLASEFSSIQRRFPNKIVTLSECGSVATINNQWQAGARWSWFMPWYDAGRTRSVVSNEFNGTNHQHANIAWWNAAFSNRYVLTRDDLPDWK
jgi:mannan endo-1,4-beta-mannosidase